MGGTPDQRTDNEHRARVERFIGDAVEHLTRLQHVLDSMSERQPVPWDRVRTRLAIVLLVVEAAVAATPHPCGRGDWCPPLP